jgi:hypothetical protein
MGPAAAAGLDNPPTTPSTAAAITGKRMALDQRALLNRVITNLFRVALRTA